MKITWFGHSGFRIEIEGAVLLIDPWLTGNPMFPSTRRAEAVSGATHVFLTHGHGDHTGDACAVARAQSIPVAGIYDLTEYLKATQKVSVISFNKGGTVDATGAKVTMVNACHSLSVEGAGSVGSEAGFMIAGEGHVIYLSGDTDIMADMEWISDLHKPDIFILSAGGHYTMDMARAACAAQRYFQFKTVIPCHYRTFPLLAQDASGLKAGLAGLKAGLAGVNVIEPQVLETITFWALTAPIGLRQKAAGPYPGADAGSASGCLDPEGAFAVPVPRAEKRCPRPARRAARSSVADRAAGAKLSRHRSLNVMPVRACLCLRCKNPKAESAAREGGTGAWG